VSALSVRALNRATLARQMLLRRETIGVTDAVARLAGMQAQVPKPPFIGLWSRVEGFTREALRDAIAKRELVRATMMRGTLHLVTRDDYLAFRPALQPVLTAGEQAITKGGGPLDIPRLVAEARKFFDAQPRPFDALRDHFAALFPDRSERLTAYAVRMHLPLVLVPDDSRWSWPPDADFAVAETFLRTKIAADATPHALALRYLAAFGPATPADFQAWSGLKNTRALFEELRPQLVAFGDKKRELFDLPDAPRPDEESAAPVRFLPEYDNLLLAHADRARIIADEHRPRVVTKNLRVLATFLVDGVVAGTWSIERKKKLATLTLEPFAKLAKRDRDALVNEGERLLRFAEADAPAFAVTVQQP
jgi:hypothetical protein